MTDNTGSTDGQAPDDEEPPLYLPPLVQLAERDLDESEFAPLVEALLAGGHPEELSQPVSPDGRSVIDLVAGEFAHGRSRERLSARLRGARDTLPG